MASLTMYNRTYVETLLPEYNDSSASIRVDSELTIVRLSGSQPLARPLATARSPVVTLSKSAAARTNPNVSARVKFDILAFLPPEIAVHVLRELHPRHLCR